MIIFNEYTKNEFSFPENYNELSRKQLIDLAGFLRTEKDTTELRLKVLYALLGVSKHKFFTMRLDIKSFLLENHLEWVFAENTLTEQLIPEYRGFHGPKKEFNNLILSEFHWAEVYYSDLVNDDDKETAKNNLIAVLYRKPKEGYNAEIDTDGDIRTPFNPNVIPFYAAQVATWAPDVKEAILLFYDGCRQYLCGLYDRIFAGNSDSETEAGMFDVIRNLAGNKYGDFQKVEQLNLHTALYEIEKSIEEAEEIDAKLKNQTT